MVPKKYECFALKSGPVWKDSLNCGTDAALVLDPTGTDSSTFGDFQTAVSVACCNGWGKAKCEN